jgi:predicted transcriptional regulator
MINKISYLKKDILIVRPNIKFKLFLKKFNLSKIKLCFVVNKSKLIGTITDGDIRRSLIREISANDNIESILNRKPIKIFLSKKNKFNYTFLKKKGVKFLPVVNQRNFYKGYIDIDEIFESMLLNKLKELYLDLRWDFPSLNPNIGKFFSF